jgi:hypothetical protein
MYMAILVHTSPLKAPNSYFTHPISSNQSEAPPKPALT